MPASARNQSRSVTAFKPAPKGQYHSDSFCRPAGAGPSEACEWHFKYNLGSQSKDGPRQPAKALFFAVNAK
jgi:hypothetical protein